MTSLAPTGLVPIDDRSPFISPSLAATALREGPVPERTGPWARATTALFEASSQLTSEADRRQARLLASLDLALVFVFLASAVATMLLPVPNVPSLPFMLATGSALHTVAYMVSRTRHIRIAAFLTLGLQWFIPLAAMLSGMSPGGSPVFRASSWLSLLLLLAVGMSDVRTTVLVVLASVLVPLAGAAIHLGEPPADAAQAMALSISAGVLAIVLNRYRHQVEDDRSAELRARNAELSALGKRLAGKSAELAKSNLALDNAYRDLQRNQQSLLLSEKMASLGRLTAGIAHEMGSPLAAVRSSLTEARALTEEYDRSIGDGEISDEDHHAIARDLARSLELAARAADRAASFVRDIKSRTRDVGAHEAAPFDAVATIRGALDLLAHESARTKSRVDFTSSEPRIRLLGPAGKLAQVVTNLVSNALDANAQNGGGVVRVTLEHEPLLTGASPEGGAVVLTVVDQGPGIAEEHIHRIFEPLFTTKPVGQGTGLGLTIVHDIVKGDLRGTIDATSEPGGGAKFVVRFPADPRR